MGAANLRVDRIAFKAKLPGGDERTLINVIGTLPPRESGRSPKTIVVVAHRDNDGLSPGANDNATGTAVLLQIARQVGTTALDHTLIFASLDGGRTGNAGALELARQGEDPRSPFSPAPGCWRRWRRRLFSRRVQRCPRGPDAGVRAAQRRRRRATRTWPTIRERQIACSSFHGGCRPCPPSTMRRPAMQPRQQPATRRPSTSRTPGVLVHGLEKSGKRRPAERR